MYSKYPRCERANTMEIYDYTDPIIVLGIAFVAAIYSVAVTLAFLRLKINKITTY